ncbi:MAG: hypothetical protein OEL87_03690 [Nanoarchaeota archaeon]|nr:hypothetical protein [Nanoarchaeota archaeon]
MKSKRGGMVDKNLIELILAVAGVFLLVTLMVFLFSPGFDKEDKSSESYFNGLKDAINLADSGSQGEFFMMDMGDEDVDFYLVYFGGVSSFSDSLYGKFSYLGSGKNAVCICYKKGDLSMCRYCENLNLPIDYLVDGVSGKNIPWAVKDGVNIAVVKDKGETSYVFAEK